VVNGFPDAKEQDLSDELSYTAGTSIEVSPRVTFSGSLISRILFNTARFEDTTALGARHTGGLGRTVDRQLRSRPGDMLLMLGTLEGKYRVSDASCGTTRRACWLIQGALLFPLSDTGLTPGPTIVLGMDTNF
jgi:hypothetical protein